MINFGTAIRIVTRSVNVKNVIIAHVQRGIQPGAHAHQRCSGEDGGRGADCVEGKPRHQPQDPPLYRHRPQAEQVRYTTEGGDG